MTPQNTYDRAIGKLAAFAFTAPELSAILLSANVYRLELKDRLSQLECTKARADITTRLEGLESFLEKAKVGNGRALLYAFVITGTEAYALHLFVRSELNKIGAELRENHGLSQRDRFALKWQRRGIETFLEKLYDTEFKLPEEW